MQESAPGRAMKEYLSILKLAAAAEKRDAVAHCLAHLEEQAAFAGAEIKRLQQRKASFERWRERLEEYVIRTIKSLGTDPKGKYRKLEGNTVTFSLRACPVSVEITDARAVPREFKAVTVKIDRK